MKVYNFITLCICSVLASGAVSSSLRAAVSPVQQVISLLDDLTAKIEKDGAAQEATFKKFMAWCHNAKRDTDYAIKTAESQIEGLTAVVSKASSDISTSSSEIDEITGEIASSEANIKEATGVRTEDKATFSKLEVELTESVSTLERAISILKKKLSTSTLLQSQVNTRDVKALIKALTAVLDAAEVTLPDKQQLIGLVQNDAANVNSGSIGLVQNDAGNVNSGEETGAPAAAAYKSHSKGIIEVLEDLLEKAESNLVELRKKEMVDQHNFQTLKQSLTHEIESASKELDKMKKLKSSAAETKATASSDLAATTKSLETLKDTLKVAETDCVSAESDHKDSVSDRAEELKALAAAKEAVISQMPAAAGIVYKSSASFLQIDGNSAQTEHRRLINLEVVTLVRELAKKQKSMALNQLAGKIATVLQYGTGDGEDPFLKVKAMISDMIAKIQSQMSAEESQKAYCDEQIASTNAKEEELASSVDSGKAKIDNAESKASKLKDEVADTQAQLAKLASSQAELNEIRTEESKAFATSSADLTAGLNGCKLAISTLQQYYGSSGALLQQPAVPEYHSKSDAGGSIIAMLEVIESDFGKALAQAQMAEDEAASEYEKTTQKNKILKVQLEQDVKYKSREEKSVTKDVAEFKSSLSSVLDEQESVMEYSKSIEAQCTRAKGTYEERVTRRAAEVDGLRQALQILEGETVLLQKPRHHSVFLHRQA